MKLFHDHSHVMLDRLFTYFQLSGDFLKGAGDTSQNLNLAGRQLVGSTFLLAEL